VSALGIVEAINIFPDLDDGRVSTGVDALLDPLLLEAAEEGFRDRIVPAIASPAHAWFETVGLAEAPPRVAAVLSSLIRVDQRLSRALSLNRLF
jgi:hypothetical protein